MDLNVSVAIDMMCLSPRLAKRMRQLFLILVMLSCFCVTANVRAGYAGSRVKDDPCSCAIGANSVTSITRKITLAQAKALVMAALTPEERRAPGVGIEPTDADDISSYKESDRSRFLLFNVVWDAPVGSVNVGFYDVDIYTGDVFPATGQNCGGIKNKKLEKLQRKIRYSLRLTNAAYRKLKTAGELCDPDN